MNSKTAKKIRRIADNSSNPKRAYKILKEMYIAKQITLAEMKEIPMK